MNQLYSKITLVLQNNPTDPDQSEFTFTAHVPRYEKQPFTSGEMADNLREHGYVDIAQELEQKLGREAKVWQTNLQVGHLEQAVKNDVFTVNFSYGAHVKTENSDAAPSEPA